MTQIVFFRNFYITLATLVNFKNVFKKYLFGYLVLISFSGIHANTFEKGIIKGSIIDERNVPVPFASIVLKNIKDSSLYKAELSNDQGVFLFDPVKEGTYFMQIKMVGFELFTKSSIEVNETSPVINLGALQLLPSSSNLKAINVVADKPFIERLADKMVVNIENSIVSTGSTALGVMEKLPGVQVSDEGAISLKGKPDVTVIIDGKPTMLSGENLATLLRGISSSSIQKIEIITSPSAKYDAAGSTGIINIITKKNKKEDLNGSVTVGYGQGRYEKGNLGFDLSKKNKWCNLFLSYSFIHEKSFNDFRLVRNFPTKNNPNSVIESNSYITTPDNNHTPRLGADFYLSKRTTLSLVGTALFNQTHELNKSNSKLLDANKETISGFDLVNDLKGTWNSYSGNAHLAHQLDTNRREISFDLDYANYFNTVGQRNTIISKDGNGDFLNETLSIGDQDWKLNIYSAKVDYAQPLNKKYFMETGLKSSYVYSNSDNAMFNKIPTELIYDSTRSNHFVYSENINAAYLSIRGEFKKVTFQPGLRIEQTIVDGEQLLTHQKLKRNYVKLFPSFFANYKVNDNNEWNINLARRIDRPSYHLLDPLRVLTDVGTYTQGNPNLNPVITYTSEIGYSYKYSFFVSLGYSLTLDRVMLALIHNTEKEITLRTYVNQGYSQFYNLNLTYSKKIKSWWNTNTTLTPFYQVYSGNINGYNFHNPRVFSFWFNTNNTFYLMKGLSMECAFSYGHNNSTGISLIKPMYSLNAGIKKILFKERASLTINMSDLLLTNYRRGTAYFGTADTELISNFKGRWDSRVLNVTFSYRFGKGEGRQMERGSGADDEKNRVNK